MLASAGGPVRREEHGPTYTYRGRAFARIPVAPYRFPEGTHPLHYFVGALLPLDMINAFYVIVDPEDYGLATPGWGYTWVRVGVDLVLVDTDGLIAEIVPGAFVEVPAG